MTLLRQWPLLESVLTPVLMMLRPVERILVWNLGHIDDALAVALAHLHHASAQAGQLLVFHSGIPPARRPVEWALADLRSVPRAPWLEPVRGQRSRWRPRADLLDSVLLGPPQAPVHLAIMGQQPLGPAEVGEGVRRNGYLFVADRSWGATLPGSDWEAADAEGHLYRKLTAPAREGDPADPVDTGELSLARHHERAVLVESYTSLARSLAHRFSYRGERAEDLEQVAMLALVKAADRYDPERERPFGPFATACISGELKRHFRDKMWMVRVPRSVQEMHLAIRAARDELTQANGASPTIPQIAGYLRTTEEAVLTAMEAASNSWAASLDAPSLDDDGAGTEIPVIESGFDESLDRSLLKESIRLLSPTEQLVLKRVFFDGQTQRKVAEELHVSQMQISRLVAKALAKMKRSFQPA
ncbi:MAG TPA: sigma-70 family RNA polymerase sigma factor [Acidimicrobiales bacterium]|nr:sigma-70 family RNA polymerase sigma factor [Acidimicrobiales bacterium]